jgi:hypothetical protein
VKWDFASSETLDSALADVDRAHGDHDATANSEIADPGALPVAAGLGEWEHEVASLHPMIGFVGTAGID